MAFNPIRDHPIYDALKRLLELQKSTILNGSDSGIDEQRRWYLDKIFYLATQASTRIRKKIRFSISVNGLNNLHSSAESIISELNNYIANRNVVHIDNAFNQAEQGFQIYLAQSVPAEGVNSGENSDAVIDSLKKSYETAITELDVKKAELLTQMTSLSATITDNQNSISALDTAIEKHRSESESAVSEISSSYEHLAAQIQGKFEEKVQSWEADHASELENLQSKTTDLVEKISVKELEARKLVQSAGEVLITGSYQTTADSEGKLADTYRYVTIGLFVIGILIVLSNYIIHLFNEFGGVANSDTAWVISTRFLTALVISLPAFYTARESARHRTNSDRARQRQLELTTLGPFIELLPEEAKTMIRDRLTDRYFGGTIEAHKVESPIDSEGIAKIVEGLAKAIKPTA